MRREGEREQTRRGQGEQARTEHTRRAFLRDLARLGGSVAALALLGGCGLPTAVPSSARVYRVGLLSQTTESGEIDQASFADLVARLAEMGYREGENLTIERRSVNPGVGAAGGPDENRVAAAALVNLPVDVIVTWGSAPTQAAISATSDLPIVMLLPGTLDPVARGFVASLARPGGNVTGIAGTPQEIDLKRLQLLVEAVPRVSKVAVVGGAAPPAFWEPATRLLGVEVFHATPAGFAGGFDAAISRSVEQGADALLVRSGQGTPANVALISALSVRYRLPGVFWSRSYVEAGGLMAYESRASDIARLAAGYVDRVLRGARPADLPVELPTRYDLVVNMGTARALGLTLPAAFMAQVDEVIE